MSMRQAIITTLFIIAGFGLKAQQKGDSNGSKGIASYYHNKFEGRKTATGEVFDNDKFTAASNRLKLGTYVKVTNLSNSEVVYVRINDRMAPSNKRLIDLTSLAAEELGFKTKGVTRVIVEPVSSEEGKQGIIAQKEEVASARTNEL